MAPCCLRCCLEGTAPQGAAAAGCPVGCQVEEGACPVGSDHGRAGDHPLSDQGRGNKTDGGGFDHVEHRIGVGCFGIVVGEGGTRQGAPQGSGGDGQDRSFGQEAVEAVPPGDGFGVCRRVIQRIPIAGILPGAEGVAVNGVTTVEQNQQFGIVVVVGHQCPGAHGAAEHGMPKGQHLVGGEGGGDRGGHRIGVGCFGIVVGGGGRSQPPAPVRSADDLNHLPMVVDHQRSVTGGKSLGGSLCPLEGCTMGLASALGRFAINQEGAIRAHDAWFVGNFGIVGHQGTGVNPPPGGISTPATPGTHQYQCRRTGRGCRNRCGSPPGTRGPLLPERQC